MPASIATTNTAAWSCPAPSATSAGPGRSRRGPSRCRTAALPRDQARGRCRGRCGRCIGAAEEACASRLPASREGEQRRPAIAPPMTKASDGSQLPARSRKPITLAGIGHAREDEPDAEHQAGERRRDSHGDPQTSRWRTTNTVTKPAAMKAAVATSERGDRREGRTRRGRWCSPSRSACRSRPAGRRRTQHARGRRRSAARAGCRRAAHDERARRAARRRRRARQAMSPAPRREQPAEDAADAGDAAR